MKRILNFNGVDVEGSRNTFRASVLSKLIDDPEIWFEFLEARNIVAHDYSYEKIEEVFKILPKFEQELDKLITKINELEITD